MKKIAVFTSGGDSPGMNACIRAVVRTAIYNNLEVVGIRRGYSGMIEGDFISMDSKSVAQIIQRGGTILQSARCKEFHQKEGRKKAAEKIKENRVDGIIAIGGDGTFTGARIFQEEYGIPVIGLPGTIDNDLYGTDNTIGYDTALNTVIEAVDKIRDTAASHNRLFVIEVMGKDAGFIALRSGIASGAEAILVPESPTFMDKLIQKLEKGRRSNKTSGIIIVAEGDDSGGAYKVAEHIESTFSYYEVRVSILGHIQRGGSPSAYDRVLASRLGGKAVEFLLKGHSSCMLGIVNNEIKVTPFEQSIKHNQKLQTGLLELVDILSI